jgi:hypothetical protein
MFISLCDPSKSLTFSSSIKSLWNILGGLGEKGMVVLLAECSEGLGSEALKLYVTNRMNLDEFVKHGKYVEGLEDLLYLKKALQSYNISLISTLPSHYTETKLGLRTFKKASDALDHMISNLGARAKLYVITDASNTLLMTQS